MRAAQLLPWPIRFALAIALALGACFQIACDKEPSKLDKIVEASAPSSTSTATATTAATPPKPPPITVEPGAFAIGPERVMPNDPDPVGRLAALIASRPNVEGNMVDFDAQRAAKPSHVVTMLAAIKKAKAKGAIAHTETRDKVIGTIEIAFPTSPPTDCTAVAQIAKDGAILVWPFGGGTAKRFSRGFAGPDMTLGTEGVRNAASKCESAYLLVGADDAMNWGLVFDIPTIARGGGSGADGGSGGGVPLRPTQVVIVPGNLPIGRKVTLE